MLKDYLSRNILGKSILHDYVLLLRFRVLLIIASHL